MAVAPNGRAAVAWTAQRPGGGPSGSGDSGGPLSVHGAILDAGHSRFHRARLLDRGGVGVGGGELRLAIGRDGTAAGTWSRGVEPGAGGAPPRPAECLPGPNLSPNPPPSGA